MAYSGRSFVPEAKVVKSVVGKFRDDSKFDVAVLMNWSELFYARTCMDTNSGLHREFCRDLTASSAVNLPITSASLR